MTGPDVERFPLELLIEYAQTETLADLARQTGVHPRTPHRWRINGGLTLDQADRAAISLGTHPALIWPSWLHPPDPTAGGHTEVEVDRAA